MNRVRFHTPWHVLIVINGFSFWKKWCCFCSEIGLVGFDCNENKSLATWAVNKIIKENGKSEWFRWFEAAFIVHAFKISCSFFWRRVTNVWICPNTSWQYFTYYAWDRFQSEASTKDKTQSALIQLPLWFGSILLCHPPLINPVQPAADDMSDYLSDGCQAHPGREGRWRAGRGSWQSQ